MYFDDAVRFRYGFHRRAENIDFSRPPYKPRLEITETKTYNIDGTWAHTRPSERVIVMLPPEFRDYNLPIEDHEIAHNLFPGERNENHITQIAASPVFPLLRSSFDYGYHRA